MAEEIKVKPKTKYLVACSFGPDSMALLDMLQKVTEPQFIIVCFVNYHKRKEADEEQKQIKKYCEEKNLILEIASAPKKYEGNFQTWAREFRYGFFEKMYKKYNAAGLFIGHHQDDLIETYLIQKQRKAAVKEYGIASVCSRNDMMIYRPLLKYSKKELLKHCQVNEIPFSIDTTNLENKYLRNIFRHNVVEHMGAVERENILKEIEEMNSERKEFVEDLEKKVSFGTELNIREIIALTKSEFATTLYKFFENAPEHVPLSNGRIDEIRKLCLSPQPNISMEVSKGIVLVKEYDVIFLARTSELTWKPYSYTMEVPGKLETIEFNIDFTQGAPDRNIKPKDFPITIRSPKEGDKVHIANYNCELRRLFIDWKLPSRFRSIWPVVVNNKGQIIYVPRYRKNFEERHTSKFELNFIK